MTVSLWIPMATAVQIPMPPADPLGYPVPPLLLQILSVTTLALHFLALNFTLGSLVALIWLRRRKDEGGEAVSRFLTASLPLGFSYLVTLGIPPLLFLQVIYGQMFYSSSVLIGAFWILVIPLLILAYGLLYLNKLAKNTARRRGTVILAIALLAMLSVGFLYVTNITLSMTPDRWILKYAAAPSGVSLNLDEPTFWPRLLLFLSPAFTVGGLAMVIAAQVMHRFGHPGAALSRSTGWTFHLVGRGVTLVMAGWVFATLAPRAREAATGAGLPFLMAGVVLAVATTGILFLSRNKQSLPLAVTAAVTLFLEAVALIGLREVVRTAYLAPYFSVEQVPVYEQWGMLAIFLTAMVAGLGLLIVLTRTVVKRAAARAAVTG